MRPSLFLAILGIVGNFASGFSSPTLPFVASPRSAVTGSATAKSNISRRGLFKMPLDASTITTTSRTRTVNTIARGGAQQAQASSVSSNEQPSKCPLRKFSVLLASAYGTGGVMYSLIKAIRRVLPVAIEPFTQGAVPLSQFQLGAYIATCIWFAYVEGYKGFQTKLSPLVVSRSFTLEPGYSKVHHYIFAPMYSMGLFHATKKRMIISWSVTVGVAGIVAAVKRLPYPWRNIVDAGVVAGLSWGCISIFVQYIKALVVGKVPADPMLPPKKE